MGASCRQGQLSYTYLKCIMNNLQVKVGGKTCLKIKGGENIESVVMHSDNSR